MRVKPEIDTLDLNRVLVRIVCALVVLASGAPLPMLSAAAQESTPEHVTACDVPARPITFIADLLAAPGPETTPTPVAEVPEGKEIVDPVVRTEITNLIETLIACVNQGELLRSFSLFDDEYLRRLIDPEGLMRAEVAIELAKSMATPAAVEPGEVTTLDEILTIRELADGSVIVVFQTVGGPDRDPDETQVDLFVLRAIDEDWKIVDGLADLDPSSIPPASE